MLDCHQAVLATSNFNLEDWMSTQFHAPLLALENHFLHHQNAIEAWFDEAWQSHAAPFYGSVDLRNSGFKLAPVDMNLFPGGFNNLHADAVELAAHHAAQALQRHVPFAQKILLIPENHTRNLFYLRNVAALQTILQHAGAQVRIGSLLADLDAPMIVDLENGERLMLEPLRRVGDRVLLDDGFDADFILLNNDLSSGIPEVLRHLSQKMLPPLYSGWTTRRKTSHFQAYDEVVGAFAEHFALDPWLINPYFAGCQALDFHERQGEEALADTVDHVLQHIAKKYREYHVDASPFVIVKADAGTYGMGVMTAKSADDVRALNRKQRNRMSKVKEGLAVTEVIVQEGVYSFETLDDGVAESVIYMMDDAVVGAFYRVHAGRSQDENLNAPGMFFSPAQWMPDSSTRHYAYGVVARLSLLAGAVELETMSRRYDAGGVILV